MSAVRRRRSKSAASVSVRTLRSCCVDGVPSTWREYTHHGPEAPCHETRAHSLSTATRADRAVAQSGMRFVLHPQRLGDGGIRNLAIDQINSLGQPVIIFRGFLKALGRDLH